MPRPPREKPKSRIKPPRNYASRREQLRLFMLVAGVFLVIILVKNVRQPEKWRWLMGEKPVAEEGTFDTRVRTVDDTAGDDLPGTITATNFRFRPDSALDDDARAQRRAEKDIWKQQLESLSWSQRREVARVLKAARDGKALSDEQAAAWQTTLAMLDQRWPRHIAAASETVSTDASLSDEDKVAWLDILDEMQQRWDQRLQATLAAAAAPSTLDAAQQEELRRFQSLYDELAMDEIQDDTVISRPSEVSAWFRLVEMLHNTPAKDLTQLDEAAAPSVGFRQLHQQPQDYRGRLVRIRGTARRAYHVQAPPNIVGVAGYYVFILLPASGPNSPIMVYSLDLPPGFPAIKDKDFDNATTDLHEEVEFVGYFYKRTAYLAQDGTRVAPLLIAKSPSWTPKVVAAETELPDWRVFLAVVLGLAVASAGIAMFVYVKQRASPLDSYAPAARATPQQFAALADEQLLPTTSEVLAKLAHRHSHDSIAPNDRS